MVNRLLKLLFFLFMFLLYGTKNSYSQKIIFDETFSECIGIKYNTINEEITSEIYSTPPKWSWSDSKYKADNSGWTAEGEVYQTTGCIRIGNTSTAGKAITPELKYSGSGMLYFDVVPWNGNSTDIESQKLSVLVEISDGRLDSGTKSKTIVVGFSKQLQTIKIGIENCNEYSKISFTIDKNDTKSKNRNYFLDNVKIVSSPFAFKNKKVSLNYSEALNFNGQALELLGNPDRDLIKYSSSNSDVAKVSETTGKITVCGIGETMISAQYIGDGDFKDFSDSYTLTVSKANVKIKYSQNELLLDVAKGLTYSNITLDNPMKLPVTYYSGDKSIVDVDDEGFLIFTGKEGSAKIYAKFEGNEFYNSATDSLKCTIVNSANKKKFAIVKNLDDISNGAEVIIVGRRMVDQQKYQTLVIDSYKEKNHNYSTANIEPDDDGYITVKSTTSILTISKSDKSWCLKDGIFYITAKDVKNDGSLLRDNVDSYLCKLDLSINNEDYSVSAKYAQLKRNKNCNFIGCNSLIKCYTNSKDYPIWLYSRVASAETVTLNESDRNLSAVINGTNEKVNAAIQRTFYNDSWNTWCMPFDVPKDSLCRVFGENTEVCEFSSFDNNSITISHYGGNLEAGKPYFVWPEKQIENPTFYGIKLNHDVPAASVKHGNVSLCGSYAPYPLKEDGTEFFLNSKNKLAKPKVGKNKIRGMRAFFRIENAASMPSITFVDGTASINEAKQDVKGDGFVYNLSGQRVKSNLDMLPHGVYIKNGKKILNIKY